jgi:hypothetical protein
MMRGQQGWENYGGNTGVAEKKKVKGTVAIFLLFWSKIGAFRTSQGCPPKVLKI